MSLLLLLSWSQFQACSFIENKVTCTSHTGSNGGGAIYVTSTPVSSVSLVVTLFFGNTQSENGGSVTRPSDGRGTAPEVSNKCPPGYSGSSTPGATLSWKNKNNVVISPGASYAQDCTLCPTGSFSDGTAGSSCTACPAGKVRKLCDFAFAQDETYTYVLSPPP